MGGGSMENQANQAFYTATNRFTTRMSNCAGDSPEKKKIAKVNLTPPCFGGTKREETKFSLS